MDVRPLVTRDASGRVFFFGRIASLPSVSWGV